MNNALLRKIEKAWAYRAKYVTENNLEAYRLANKYELGLPICIDIYLNKAVIYVLEEMSELKQRSSWSADLEKILSIKFKIIAFFYKQRFKKEKSASFSPNEIWGEARSEDRACVRNEVRACAYGDDRGEVRAETNSGKIVISEYGNKFLINLKDYLDTGLFLDHREARRIVGEQAVGKTVANLFAYTGSFSVCAARSGAIHTHTVDLSQVYLNWARENLDLNGLSKDINRTYKMDVFEFFKYAKRKNLYFDLIIIDPPTFSKNKKQNFSIQRDHVKLLTEAKKFLNKEGKIFFSTNFLNFILSRKLRNIFKIENITKRTLPLDFSTDETRERQIHEAFWLTHLN